MLVLTIKEGQKIHIGDDVTVSYQHCYNYEKRYNKAVKVGVDAPSNVKVIREELEK